MKKPRHVMLIDMQSFYASVEKAKNPALKNRPLVVAGDPARRSGIILAACPIAKSYGVTTAEALWQALKKCPDLVIVRPHMQEYIEKSMLISRILGDYSDLVEQYSIDEMFLEVTDTLHLFGLSPEELAKSIQHRIQTELGIYARFGIGENKIIAKLCCDMIAKKNENGIFYLKKDELHLHIYDKPVGDMWGIGRKYQMHLARMGIRTIGDLAKTEFKRLSKRWGVNGEVMWRVANGIDDSPVTPHTHSSQKVISNGMTLPRDYSKAWEIEVVLLDLTTEVTKRAREMGKNGLVVSVGCMGSWDSHTGFNRQKKMLDPTNVTLDIFRVVKEIFYEHWDEQPVRRLHIGLSQLSDAETYQLSLFSEDNEKKRKIDTVMDEIKEKFGSLAILRASSMTSAGQAVDRAAKIGGHYR